MSMVDQRVVQMGFDNQQFEKGVKVSLDTLDKLNSGLQLEGSAKGFTNLSKIVSSFSLSGIADGVDTIASKFSALGVIGITALANITNSAVEYGKRIASALTIDPISEGYADYGRKLTSVQTIMNATGQNIGVVSGYFSQLDTYADKTIYNLDDMTSAFAKFTNAGVNMDKSVPAIKGIANMVALAGQDANAAQIAMYNLSQSIAGGFLTTTDYKSLNLANVATKQWKDQMIEGAVAAKTLKKNVDGTYTALSDNKVYTSAALFNEALSNGWASADVMLSVLGKYGDTQTAIGAKAQAAAQDVKSFSMMMDTLKASVGTGWTDTFEILVGNLEEAKKLFTPLTTFIGGFLDSTAKARNQMLGIWKDNGGRDALIESLSNAFKGLQSIIKPVSEAFKEIFPPMTGERLAEITKQIRDLTSHFTISQTTSDNLKSTFKGLFAILDIGKQAFEAIIKAIKPVFEYFGIAGGGLLGFTGNIGEYIVSLDNAIKKTDFFQTVFKKLGEFLKPIADGIKSAIKTIVDTFDSLGDVDMGGLDSFSDRVSTRFEPFTKLGELIKFVFEKIANIVKAVAPIFVKLANIVGEGIGAFSKHISDAISDINYDKTFDIINGGLFAAILLGIKSFIGALTTLTANGSGILGGVKNILDGVKDSLTAYQTQLKAKTLLTIAIAIAVLAASVIALSLVDSDKLTSALTAMSVMFVELFGSMAVFEKITKGSSFKSMIKVSAAMVGLSIAVLILSTAMVKISQLDWAGIVKGLTSIGILSAMMVGASTLLSKSSGKMAKGALGLILFAEAINIMVDAVKKLGTLDIPSLAKGLIGVGILMTELVVFMKATDVNKMGIGKSVGLILLAAAINILASAVSKFGALDIASLGKGLGAMAIVLAELAVFINLTGDAKRVTSTATGLVIMGAAMLIFAEAIKNMGNLSMEQIGKGLLTMAGALTLVAVALNFMPKNMILTGTGLVIIASSLLILSKAISSMGNMSAEQIAKGLITMAGSLAIITVAVSCMKKALSGALALFVIATALAILAPVLKIFGSMSLEEIGKGLLVLAGTFAVIGLAGLVLGPVVPVIFALAGAIALLGIAALAIGVGLLAFSAGLTTLAISGTAGAAALVIIVTSLISLIPLVIAKLGEGILLFAKVLADGAPALASSIITLVSEIIKVIVELTPKIIDAIFTVIVCILEKIDEYMPRIVAAGLGILLSILQGISDNIKRIVEIAIQIVINFVEGIASMLPKVIQAGFDLIISFINGLADAIRNNTDKLGMALINLFFAAIEGAVKFIIDAVGKVKDAGSQLISSGFIKGIAENIKDAVFMVAGIPERCITALEDAVSGFITAGENVISGFVQGIKNKVSDVVHAAADLGQKALGSIKNFLGIHSPSRAFAEIGKYSALGMAGGLDAYSKVVSASANNMGENATDSLSNAMSNISLGTIDANQPTIRPVVDLTDVMLGSKQIDNIFSGSSAIVANANISAAKSKSNADDVATTLVKINDQSNSKLTAAIDKINEMVDGLVETISSLSVIMDSGELVGAIASKMDSALGQTAAYKGRTI